MTEKRILLGSMVDHPSRALGGGDDWHIDLEALVEGRLLITGNSGSGKSRTLRRLIEQAAGKIQIIVIDREGEYFSLREKFDFLLLGGENGDSPVEVSRASTICKTLIEISASAVIDLYDLTVDQQLAFTANFLDELMLVPVAARRHIMLVIDEADFFADQDQAKSRCTVAMKEVAQRGRKRGIVPVMATNRPAQIAKSVSGPCVNKIIGRQSDDVDITRALKNLGFPQSRANDVVQLAQGHFWCKGPAFDEQVPTLIHVGEVQTTHPRLGMKAPPPPPPSKRVAELLAALRAPMVIEDLEPQKGSIAEELRRTLKITPGLEPPEQLARARAEGFSEGRAALRGAVENLHYSAVALAAEIEGLVEQLSNCGSIDGRTTAVKVGEPKNGKVEVSFCPPAGAPPIKEVMRVTMPLNAVPRPAWKGEGMRTAFLRTLAELGPQTRKRLHLWADYRETGTSGQEIAQMLRDGLIDSPEPGMVRITAKGQGLIGNVKQRSRGKMLDHVLSLPVINSTEKKFLKIISKYPEGISRSFLHAGAGIKPSGTSGQNISKLVKLGLAIIPKAGYLQLHEDLRR